MQTKIPYSKPWLDVPDQVAKLQSRGLAIANIAEAERFIRYVNYYRFSGFCLHFQHKDAVSNDRVFEPGVTFDDIVYLCRFGGRLGKHNI